MCYSPPRNSRISYTDAWLSTSSRVPVSVSRSLRLCGWISRSHIELNFSIGSYNHTIFLQDYIIAGALTATACTPALREGVDRASSWLLHPDARPRTTLHKSRDGDGVMKHVPAGYIFQVRK